MYIHYAIQTCDVAFNQVSKRYCNTDKATLIRKCVTSFFVSVKYAAEQDPTLQHTICVIDDHSTTDTILYLKKLVEYYNKDNIKCVFKQLEGTGTAGVMASIRSTYEWLKDNGIDLVYQVQDDYLFHPSAIIEMIDIYRQMWKDCKTHPIITPWNQSELWLNGYRYWASPRTVIVGKKRYWIQIYDISCSFMTHVIQLKEQWDLIEIFLALPPTGLPDGSLESISLNYMLVRRGILGLVPIESLALHIQSEKDKDPYIDWKEWWDQVQEVELSN